MVGEAGFPAASPKTNPPLPSFGAPLNNVAVGPPLPLSSLKTKPPLSPEVDLGCVADTPTPPCKSATTNAPLAPPPSLSPPDGPTSGCACDAVGAVGTTEGSCAAADAPESFWILFVFSESSVAPWIAAANNGCLGGEGAGASASWAFVDDMVLRSAWGPTPNVAPAAPTPDVPATAWRVVTCLNVLRFCSQRRRRRRNSDYCSITNLEGRFRLCREASTQRGCHRCAARVDNNGAAVSPWGGCCAPRTVANNYGSDRHRIAAALLDDLKSLIVL